MVNAVFMTFGGLDHIPWPLAYDDGMREGTTMSMEGLRRPYLDKDAIFRDVLLGTKKYDIAFCQVWSEDGAMQAQKGYEA